MKQPLNQTLKRHVDQQQLGQDQLDALLDMQPPHPRQRRVIASAGVAWASAAALVLVAIMLVSVLPWNTHDEHLYDEIAAEVVSNHLHRKPLEVTTNDITQIQGYFNRLDFMPRSSAYLADSGLNLIGGRYCSLQGVTAAQLRLQSAPESTVRTLYEVGYDEQIFKQLPNYDNGEQPVSVWSKGIKVTLWAEMGILFALTEEPESGVNLHEE